MLLTTEVVIHLSRVIVNILSQDATYPRSQPPKHGGQFHTHLTVEKLPASLNTQDGMETLFHNRLPNGVKALPKWKSVDLQRINPDEPDYRRNSSYMGKQTNLELIALDQFNSNLSRRQK
jgi:hypothetical protein